ncbi:MAG: PKD domain-containing protein [Candidatus Poribacteria bacterium]
MKSVDGGISFSEPVRVDDSPDSSYQNEPSIAVGDEGTVYAVWEDNRTQGGSFATARDIYFSYSVDYGESFEANVKVNDDIDSVFRWYPVIAVDELGNINVAWVDYREDSLGDIYFAHGRTPRPAQAPVAFLNVSPDSPRPAGFEWAFDASQSYDPDGDMSEYNFDFGDGSNTGWISNSVVTHIYQKVGEHYASVTVKDKQGLTASSSLIKITVHDQIHGIEAVVTIDNLKIYEDWEGSTGEYTPARFSIQQNFVVPTKFIGSTVDEYYWIQNTIRVYESLFGDYKMDGGAQIWHFTEGLPPPEDPVANFESSSVYDLKNTVTLRSIIKPNGDVTIQNDFGIWSFPLPTNSYIYLDWKYYYSGEAGQLIYGANAPEIVFGGPGKLVDRKTGEVAGDFPELPFAAPTSGHVDTYVELDQGKWYVGKRTGIGQPIGRDQAKTAEYCTGLRWDIQTGDFVYDPSYDSYLNGPQNPEQGFWFEPDFDKTVDLPPEAPPAPATRKALKFNLASPAFLSIFDSLGRHVGYNANTDSVDAEIPDVIYLFGDTQSITIFDPSEMYRVEIIGTGDGNVTLDIFWQNVTGPLSKIVNMTFEISEGDRKEYVVRIIEDKVNVSQKEPEFPLLWLALAVAAMAIGTASTGYFVIRRRLRR